MSLRVNVHLSGTEPISTDTIHPADGHKDFPVLRIGEDIVIFFPDDPIYAAPMAEAIEHAAAEAFDHFHEFTRHLELDSTPPVTERSSMIESGRGRTEDQPEEEWSPRSHYFDDEYNREGDPAFNGAFR